MSCEIPLVFPRGAALAAEAPIVIQNANVLTVTKGSFRGSVLIRDGKIAEMGEKVIVPQGAQIIDAGGPEVSHARHHRRALAHQRGCDQ